MITRVVCGEPNGVGEDTNKTTCSVVGVGTPKKNVIHLTEYALLFRHLGHTGE